VTLITSGQPNFNGFGKLFLDIEANEMFGTPMILGGGAFSRFALMARNLGQSAGGVNFGGLINNNPLNFFYDPTADTVLGADQFLNVMPGHTKFVPWNRYANNEMFARKFGTSWYGTFVDPRLPNLTFDLEIKEINCPQPYYVVTVSLQYGVFVQPANAYKSDDRLFGIRGLYRYKALSS
jgi:hypothetical protein